MYKNKPRALRARGLFLYMCSGVSLSPPQVSGLRVGERETPGSCQSAWRELNRGYTDTDSTRLTNWAVAPDIIEVVASLDSMG